MATECRSQIASVRAPNSYNLKLFSTLLEFYPDSQTFISVHTRYMSEAEEPAIFTSASRRRIAAKGSDYALELDIMARMSLGYMSTDRKPTIPYLV